MSPRLTPARPASRARGGDDGDFVPAPRPGRGHETSRPETRPQRIEADGAGSEPRQVRPEPETKLSPLETRVLAFEARWWRASGAKTQAIADELDLTPERYYQHLARLIDHPEAAAEQPVVIRRLKAARAKRLGR
ncbi:DUF3263 domain-containing protein [Glycomyces buryatensis]|uniref:DUF3263 domain-containing protein n=1 Tax=Glycomyces buryatensis TaxID=2570927 RepID=A0A4S8QG75_9ACTN|nr:DUF3263 domain-containing protein [Glycomyces buryatensis]THV43370.1 DUF3263 domain-containing protein [Glycomyces buryatensis]